jgi:DNA-binding SARP family transcriptional activator
LLDPVVCLVEAAMADLAGDPRGALEAIERIDVGAMVDPGVELLVLNWSASLHVLVGDTTEAVRCSEEAARSAAARDGRPIQTVLAHWFDGNPRPAAANPLGWGESDEHVSARDRFLADVYGAVLSASFGRHFPVELGELRARGASHGRDLVFAAVAVASQLVVAGQEDEAGAVLAEALATCGAHDPLAQVELLRFAPYALVLDPSLTEALVRRALGPAHHRNLALVELFLACRAGRRADWRMLPSPTEVFTALPLPWTLELAAWALRAERPEALEIVDLASELAGPETRAVLRRLAEDDVAGGGAARLLGAVRWTPAQPVRVEVLGPLRVVHGDVPVEGGALRRRRVRELLALLVLRRRATREVAMDLLWPDLDADRARNNLNVNLRWVRTLLEPERSRGEAPFFVRSRGDDLVLLPPSELFSIDLDDAERSIDRARRAEDVGDVEAAATAYESVLELWRGEPFEDLLAVDGTREAREHLRSTLLDAACRAGELRLSTSAIDRALAHAARALDHDPFSERAHGIVVAAHLQRGDLASASRAVERCREAMDTLGVPLGENARMLARQIEARAAEDV